jgi:hypothetical protein
MGTSMGVALEKYWSYVVAMLTNLGELKIDRIQSMLGMFASDYRGTPELLSVYLNTKVREGILIRSSTGAYSLVKKD